MAETDSRSNDDQSRGRRRPARLARLLALWACIISILGAGGIAADYLLPQDGPPSERLDSKGRIESLDTGTGEVKLFKYHASGLLTEASYARRGRFSKLLYPVTRTVRAELDKALRRTALEDQTGRTTFELDELGLLVGVAQPSGLKLAYTRGPWGEVRAIDLPDQQKLRYGYDALLRPTRVTDGDAAITYEYRDDERELVRHLPNGIVTLYKSDERGAARLIRHTGADGQLILELRYQRDAEGRVVRRDEVNGKGTRTWEFAYDPLGRLVRERGPDGAVDFELDPDGNLVARKDAKGVTRFTYKRGQLMREARYRRKEDGRDLVEETRFEYDRRGRLLAKRDGNGSIEYDWSVDGQLVAVHGPEGTVRYIYNGDGLRVAREADGRRTEYLHHLGGILPEVIVERDAKGGIAHDILGLSRVGRRRADGSRVFYLEDQLGSTRVVVDEKGEAIARYEYSEFGVPKRVEGTAEAPYLYTGQSWDPDTELLFLRNRYYSPSSARFISPDPHPPSLANPQSLNRYAYCEGDPINKIDPTGLQPWQPPPPPPPPPTFYDPNRELWRMLSLHRELPSAQLFRPLVLPPAIHDPVQSAGYSRPPAPPPPPPTPTPKPGQSEVERYGLDAVQLGLGVGAAVSGPVGALCMGLACGAISVYEAYRYESRPGLVGELVELGGGAFLDTGSLVSPAFDAKMRVLTPALSVAGILDDVSPEVWSHLPAMQSWNRQLVQTLVSPLDPGRVLPALSAAADNIVRGGRGRDPLDTFAALDPFVAGTFNRTRNAFFPPPPPPGGPGSPLVGGVYFDQAKVLGDLGAITGAVFDRASGRLVLMGDSKRTLPPMKPEILAAAIRAVYAPCREAPGMTIDPHPENPRGPIMLVRFFCTEHTELGQVMFESDRLLKAYSVGTDNVSKELVTSNVPGYKSVTERSLDLGSRSNDLWSRFWIVPDPVTAKVSDDGILFDPVRLRVKTETMRFANGKLVPAGGEKDPVAENFASHFTAHYADFAKERPVFAQLEVAALAVALARWLKENGVPADWGFVGSVLAEPYLTPTTTPSALNELSKSSNGLVRSVQVVGGVEMQPKLAATRDPKARDIAKQVIAEVDNLPEDGPTLAKLQIGGREQSAAVFPANAEPPLGAFEAAERDLELPPWATELESLPGLTRFYSSINNRPTELGRWSLRLPRLERECDPNSREGTVPTLSFEGMAPVSVERFALTDGLQIIRFVKPFPDQELRRIGFAPEPGGEAFRGIYPEGDDLYRLYHANGNQAVFGSDARLRAVFRGEAAARYHFRGDGRLHAVEYQKGERRIEARFERDDSGRVTRITAGDRRVDYEYNGAGDLVASRGARTFIYRHDEGHRPIEMAVDGSIVRSQKFDDAGRLKELSDGSGSTVKQSLERTPSGTTITRVGASGTERAVLDGKLRPKRIEEASGTTRDFHYDGDALKRVTTTLPGGGQASVEYSTAGKPVVMQDPSGTKTAIQYLPDGRPLEVSINGESLASFEYGASGLQRVVYRGGYEERFQRDANGTVVGYARIAPGERVDDPATWLRFDGRASGTARGEARPSSAERLPRVAEDADGRPMRIESPDGTVSTISYGAQGELAGIEISRGAERRALEVRGPEVTVRTSTGGSVRYISDDQHKLSSVRDASGGLTSYTYGPNVALASICLPSGRLVECGDALASWECAR